jgi:O-antigen ligase
LLSRLLPDVVASGGITRLTEWRLTWPTIAQHLVFGGGPDARRLGIRAIFWNERVVHNAPLWVWMKFGLIGLFTLMALVVTIAYYAFKAMSPRSEEDYIGVAIVAVLPYLVAASATGTPLIENRTLLLSALLGALALTVSGAARRSGTPASVTSADPARAWAAARIPREGA